jgi:hypothetical protein
MKSLVLALVVAVAVVAADHHEDHHEHQPKTAEFEKIDSHLDELTARLENLKGKIHARTDPARVRKAHSLEERVINIEGNGCARKEFQCGSSDPQCVGRLLVCDGIKDCRNGHDEELCELPTKAGDYFEGHVITDTCTKRRPDVISFEVKTIRHDEYFRSVAFMRVTIDIEFSHGGRHGKVSLPTVGYYSFGARKLIITPPEEDRLGLTCAFDGYDLNHCKGEIKHEASLETCATILFSKKHH